MRGVVLIIILGVFQGSHPQTISVSQIPAVATTAGTSVTLQCNYTVIDGETTGIGWFRWYRHVENGPEVSDNNPDYKGRVSRVGQNDFINGSADIVLHSVIASDTGMYICHVMLQDHKKVSGYGSGTFLNVTELQTSSYEAKHPIIYGGAGAVVLVIFIIAAVYLCCTKRAKAAIREEGPILYTDFSSQATRQCEIQTPANQVLQTTHDQVYQMENNQYMYASCLEHSKKQTRTRNQDMALYSEIP